MDCCGGFGSIGRNQRIRIKRANEAKLKRREPTLMDWKKVAIGAAIAIGGSTLTYLTTVVIPAMEASGDAKLLAIAAAFSIGINVLRNYWKSKNAG